MSLIRSSRHLSIFPLVRKECISIFHLVVTHVYWELSNQLISTFRSELSYNWLSYYVEYSSLHYMTVVSVPTDNWVYTISVAIFHQNVPKYIYTNYIGYSFHILVHSAITTNILVVSWVFRIFPYYEGKSKSKGNLKKSSFI